MLLRNNESSISTTVDAGISEVYIKLNQRDFKLTYQVGRYRYLPYGTGRYCGGS